MHLKRPIDHAFRNRRSPTPIFGVLINEREMPRRLALRPRAVIEFFHIIVQLLSQPLVFLVRTQCV
jgi:hypothetical protein